MLSDFPTSEVLNWRCRLQNCSWTRHSKWSEGILW